MLSPPARFVINGVGAAAVHFSVLAGVLSVLGEGNAGASNLIAATAGTSTSFLGNRYFVFRAWDEPILRQFARFWILYGALALLHCVVLTIWTDWARLDYRIGFLLGTALQTLLTYIGGKNWLFKARN